MKSRKSDKNIEDDAYEGMDKIFNKMPHFSGYQFLITCLGSWMCFCAGQVQTGSVFLQAAPEEYRCHNKLDEIAEGADYWNAEFASGGNCKVFDIDWEKVN